MKRFRVCLAMIVTGTGVGVVGVGTNAFGFTYPQATPNDAGLAANLFQIYDQDVHAAKSGFNFKGGFLEIKAKVSARLQALNRLEQIDFLAHLPKPSPSSSPSLSPNPNPGLTWLTETEVQALQDTFRTHLVVSDAALDKYDHDRQIGFCFGRAAYAHIELLRRGVSPDSIAKVFVFGRLVHQGRGWDFHMATMTRGPGLKWWVLDGLQTKVLPLEEWTQEVLKLDGDVKRPKLRFYYTSPLKFQPIPGGYDLARCMRLFTGITSKTLKTGGKRGLQTKFIKTLNC